MDTLTSLNWLDIVLALIIVCSAIAGLRAGFTRVVIGLLALIVGLVMGFWFYRLVGDNLHPWIKNPTAANAVGFFLIFFGVALLGSIVAALLSKVLRWVGLSWFNYLLGGVAGFARGALIVAVLANVLVAFAPSPVPDYLRNSRVLPYANGVASLLAEIAPRNLKDSFAHQMDSLKQIWANHEKHSG
jgi:membrane protein required for colicin V production